MKKIAALMLVFVLMFASTVPAIALAYDEIIEVSTESPTAEECDTSVDEESQPEEPTISPAASGFPVPFTDGKDITLNFPGIENATVRFFTNGVWHTIVAGVSNTSSFTIPETLFPAMGTATIQIIRGGMNYSFNLPAASFVVDAAYTRDIPILTITVTGIWAQHMGVNIGVAQADWVYGWHTPAFNAPNTFNVFGNGRPYRVYIRGVGYSPKVVTVQAGDSVDFTNSFYNIAIPEGISNVSIRNVSWVDTTVWQSDDYVGSTAGSSPRDVFTLFRNETPAVLYFTAAGEEHSIEFMLDGTDPFANLVLVRFPGMSNITDINTQMTGNGWTYRPGLNAADSFIFINDKWNGSMLLQVIAEGLYFQGNFQMGPPTFTIIDIPITTITVINNIALNLHVSTQQTGAAGQNAPGRNGIWFDDWESGVSELVFPVFDYGLHWVRAGAPVNGHGFVTINGVLPGARVYLDGLFPDVTFVVQYGAVGVLADSTTSKRMSLGGAIAAADIPSHTARTGFYFAGWYRYTWEYPYLVSCQPEGYVVEGDVTFVARFNPLYHDITFVVGEGGAATTRVQQVRDGMSIQDIYIAPTGEIPLVQALSGWNFVGWQMEDPVGIYPNGAMTFTAVFERCDYYDEPTETPSPTPEEPTETPSPSPEEPTETPSPTPENGNDANDANDDSSTGGNWPYITVDPPAPPVTSSNNPSAAAVVAPQSTSSTILNDDVAPAMLIDDDVMSFAEFNLAVANGEVVDIEDVAVPFGAVTVAAGLLPQMGLAGNSLMMFGLAFAVLMAVGALLYIRKAKKGEVR